MISEDSIIQRAQNGNALAFARLHDEYYPFIYRFFYYRLFNPQDTEELTSDLFEMMVEKIGFYAPGEMKFISWLYSLANQLMMTHTNEHTGVPSQTPKSTPQATDTAQQLSPAARLRASLAMLRPDERELIIRRLIERCSLCRVASEINRSLSTARSLQHVALTHLKGMLQEVNSCNEA